jgi:hypothetical protein
MIASPLTWGAEIGVAASFPERGKSNSHHFVSLTYNVANFVRQLALPRPVRTWTLTTLLMKLIKIGAKVIGRAKAVTFQLTEVTVPRSLFATILGRIGRLRAAPSPG